MPKGNMNRSMNTLSMMAHAASCLTPSMPLKMLITSNAHHSIVTIHQEGSPNLRYLGICITEFRSKQCHDSLRTKFFFRCTYSVSAMKFIEYVVAVATATPTMRRSSKIRYTYRLHMCNNSEPTRMYRIGLYTPCTSKNLRRHSNCMFRNSPGSTARMYCCATSAESAGCSSSSKMRLQLTSTKVCSTASTTRINRAVLR
mmetsp:Transcript_25016/g.28727  ORF Transcript_25016/g.28727 Transcript_25016/m.28727 type:complete len:200 (-) Transcript_25016:419-1018(-)